MKILLSTLAIALAFSFTAPVAFADNKAKTEGQSKSSTKAGCDKNKGRSS